VSDPNLRRPEWDFDVPFMDLVVEAMRAAGEHERGDAPAG
jgi:hypothetical protein